MFSFFKKSIDSSSPGSSLIGSLFVILAMGYLGYSSLVVSSSETQSSNHDYLSSKALYIGQTCLEHSKLKLYQGEDPAVSEDNPVYFDGGYYYAESDADSGEIRCISYRGNSKRVQTIQPGNYAKNCLSLDVSSVSVEGASINNVMLIKTCNESETLSKLWLAWNEEISDDESSEDSESKIVICHYPPGNSENPQELCIASSAASAHLNHGDYMGSCDGSPDDAVEYCDSSSDDSSTESSAPFTGNLQKVELEALVLYDANLNIGTPTTGADSGEEVVLEEEAFYDNGVYILNFTFSDTLPSQADYDLTLQAKDESQLTGSFSAANSEVDETEDDSSSDDTVDCTDPKVLVCHVPPGNPENAHEICVAAAAVDALTEHGDYVGECLEESETDSSTEDDLTPDDGENVVYEM